MNHYENVKFEMKNRMTSYVLANCTHGTGSRGNESLFSALRKQKKRYNTNVVEKCVLPYKRLF